MALPDRFEQVGIIIGTVFLISLPMSALGTAVFGLNLGGWQAALLWLLPGLVLGGLLVTGRLAVTYHQVWVFSLSSWLLTLAGWTLLGLSIPPTDRGLSVSIWLIALGLGALIARIRPVHALLRRLRPARSR